LRTAVAVAVAAGLLLGAPAALAHQGNPHYRSEVQRITPPVKGVTVSVLNFDDRLLLQNTSGRDVVVEDYSARPYARVLADRTVEVNTNSPAYYLNGDRNADVQVPKGLGTQPSWKLVDRTGRFQWHDHRMHWMGNEDPPELRDKSRRTHIFDWKVPIRVDGRPGVIAGSLTWVPLPGGSAPLGAIWGLAALVIVLSLGVFAVRRRRAGAAGGNPPERPDAEAEAW
jgi:hypothetical protein